MHPDNSEYGYVVFQVSNTICSAVIEKYIFTNVVIQMNSKVSIQTEI